MNLILLGVKSIYISSIIIVLYPERRFWARDRGFLSPHRMGSWEGAKNDLR